ncbi:MAG: 3-oxoacyl-ACP reductase family protein [Candidatus Zixiibacteriota bacterium]
MFNLEGKVAVITGASRGIGRAAAIMFAQAGCNVVVNFACNELAAAEVVTKAASHGVRAIAVQADVSVKTDAEKLISKSVQHFGGIDILVNNAGIWKEAAIESMTESELSEMLDINIKGVFFPSTAAVPHMKAKRSGNIIHIASTAGQRGEALHSHYAASKGAVISLTKSLASELAPHNIRVNCVAPGWVDTDMSREELNAPDAQRHLRLIPLGRPGSAEEIAGPILFLASNLSTFITGEILNVNGGAVLCG